MTLGDGTARRLASVLFTTMAIAIPILSAGVVWAVAVNKDQNDQLKAQLSQIQAQRVDNARIVCADQNEANARLRVSLLKFIPHPTAAQRKAIWSFADAIAVRRTKRECDAFVLARVGHK